MVRYSWLNSVCVGKVPKIRMGSPWNPFRFVNQFQRIVSSRRMDSFGRIHLRVSDRLLLGLLCSWILTEDPGNLTECWRIGSLLVDSCVMTNVLKWFTFRFCFLWNFFEEFLVRNKCANMPELRSSWVERGAYLGQSSWRRWLKFESNVHSLMTLLMIKLGLVKISVISIIKYSKLSYQNWDQKFRFNFEWKFSPKVWR